MSIGHLLALRPEIARRLRAVPCPPCAQAKQIVNRFFDFCCEVAILPKSCNCIEIRQHDITNTRKVAILSQVLLQSIANTQHDLHKYFVQLQSPNILFNSIASPQPELQQTSPSCYCQTYRSAFSHLLRQTSTTNANVSCSEVWTLPGARCSPVCRHRKSSAWHSKTPRKVTIVKHLVQRYRN